MKREAIETLLGRPARSLDLSRVRRTVAGATVLVTGAGGSIGSQLCRQLAELGCGRIVALDNSDHALIDVLTEVRRAAPGATLKDYLCDVRDSVRLQMCMREARPDIVIHAAALKHVHMGDRHPAESVLTNLVGVRNAADAARNAGASRFLLVSSDKAAAPGSVMGACKRLSELYIDGRRRAAPDAMKMASVRFGNVFGSAGSVSEIFERQIAEGGPVTVTHRDMRRYFMTVEEAVQLILLVCAADEVGGAYLLDMGNEVRIMELARRMIAATGAEIPIVITGVREGEKLNEQLTDEHETCDASEIEGVLCIRPSGAAEVVTDQEIMELERAVRTVSDEVVRHRVFALLDSKLARSVSVAG